MAAIQNERDKYLQAAGTRILGVPSVMTYAPTNDPVPLTAIVTANDDGSRDIKITWSYAQGTVRADAFGVLWNESRVSQPGTPSIGAANGYLILNKDAASYLMKGVSPETYYTFAIVAGQQTDAGYYIGNVVTIAGWQIAAGVGNYVANINGQAASIVQSYAAASYTGTVLYRSTGAPTNNPAPLSTSITPNTIGGRDIQLNWSGYTQGAKQADGLLLFYRAGSGTPAITDASFQFNVTASASFHLFQNVAMDAICAGIAAFRRTENGLEIGAIQTIPAWSVAAGVIDNRPSAGSVTGGTIVAGAVTADKTNIATIDAGTGLLVANSVNISQIVSGAVTDLKIAAGAVTAAKTAIAAINSTTGNLTANSVVASNIVAGTITGDKIAAATITSDKITVGTLSAITANLGTVNAGSIIGSANISISGSAVFNGSYAVGGYNYAVVCNASGGQQGGCYGMGINYGGYFYATGDGSVGMAAGTGGVNGTGAYVTAGLGGKALRAVATSTATGVDSTADSGTAARGDSISGRGGWFTSSTNVGVEANSVGSWGVSCSGGAGGFYTYSGTGTGTKADTSSGIAGQFVASNFYGFGVSAHNTGGGVGLRVGHGSMTISDSTLVVNLNADKLDGLHGGSYCQVVGTSSGNASTNGGGAMFFTSSVSGIGTRTTDANTFNVYSVSDARIKHDIHKEKLGLEFIKKLKPKTYRLNDAPERLVHGFIAQDVKKLIGNVGDVLYEEHENGICGTDYVALIAPLVKAVQELTKRLETIENERN